MYFTCSGGKVKIIGAVSSYQNGTKDIIICTLDNKPETIKQGVIDFLKLEKSSQNYFYLDDNCNLKSASSPAYFYYDSNNNLKFVDKENCHVRIEKNLIIKAVLYLISKRIMKRSKTVVIQ